MTKDPARCIPILASLDIAETLTFYRDQLGFAGEAWGDYALVRRDEMELHFWLAKDRIHPEHTACYIRGGQVPALFEEFSARNVPGLTAFEVKPWNMLEFAILDPHGNLLRFGCAPQEVGNGA
ncbi:VOC family protein [Roseomonas terrae]|jgi:catechol 2,3-dioxygenase-like lactoylglutathione lyase family enzyme|uniref:VOC family protein n=1 Tax=Neoroseomonas terrae TaxID=424799 RepID=A0ABS5END3_9PROT|nr:VOC family protein [Neoroseomonas terrae]MBR0652544.1 VOC family protein [Neoroseomonas terrae]